MCKFDNFNRFLRKKSTMEWKRGVWSRSNFQRYGCRRGIINQTQARAFIIEQSVVLSSFLILHGWLLIRTFHCFPRWFRGAGQYYEFSHNYGYFSRDILKLSHASAVPVRTFMFVSVCTWINDSKFATHSQLQVKTVNQKQFNPLPTIQKLISYKNRGN